MVPSLLNILSSKFLAPSRLEKWNQELTEDNNRKVVLLVDNFKGHQVDTERFTNIQLVFFAPNLTSKLQPLKQGIVEAFKTHYRCL